MRIGHITGSSSPLFHIYSGHKEGGGSRRRDLLAGGLLIHPWKGVQGSQDRGNIVQTPGTP